MTEAVTDLTRGIYRRLYSGFTKGQRINKLSLQAEAWFWRVMATADDFGNADAEPGLCLAATVGRRAGITLPQVSKWLEEMRESGLIQMYADESGDKYLHIIGFEAMQPAGKNGKRVCRFPRPDESRLIQNDPDFLDSGSASHSDNHTDTYSDTDTQASAMPFASDEFKKAMADLEKHRKEIRHKITDETRKAMYAEFAEWGEVRAIAAIRLSIRKGWRGVFESKESGNGNRTASKVDNSLAAAGRVAAKYEQRG